MSKGPPALETGAYANSATLAKQRLTVLINLRLGYQRAVWPGGHSGHSSCLLFSARVPPRLGLTILLVIFEST